jgi:Heterokaryon incompatibility protein (HET)
MKQIRSTSHSTITIGSELKSFWADALCINQNDVGERNHQVQLMRSIYVSAESVIAWLGPENERTPEFTLLLETVIRELNDKKPGSHDAIWMAKYPDFWYQSHGPGAVTNLYFWAYNQFKSRPYWKRIWTLQEMVLAKRLSFLDGSKVISYDTLARFHSWINSLAEQSEWFAQYPFISHGVWAWISIERTWDAFDRVDKLRNRRITAPKESSGIDLSIVVTCADLVASDAKDNIFGLIGMCQSNIIPDYTQSTKSVFCNYFFHYVSEFGNLGLLGLSGFSETSNVDLPSWTPNWETLPTGNFIGFPSELQSLFHANSGLENVNTLRPPADDILLTQGVVCSHVVSVVDQTETDGVSDFLVKLKQGYSEPQYPTGIPILQAIFRTLMQDIDVTKKERLCIDSDWIHHIALSFLRVMIQDSQVEDLAPRKLETLLRNFGIEPDTDFQETYRREFFPNMSPNSLAQWSTASKALDHHRGPVFHVSWHVYLSRRYRKFFVTQDGYFGLGPVNTKDDDIIVVLPGFSIPVLLRKVDSHYVHIGACFVLGLMEGEAGERVRSGKAHVQEFEIY